MVPRWCAMDEEADWDEEVNAWLARFHLSYLLISNDPNPEGYCAKMVPTLGWHLICGFTKGGTAHATVGFGGEIVHDPFPSMAIGATVLEPHTEDTPWEIGLLLATKPHLNRRQHG